MDQHTVLIADSSEDFCSQLQDILRWGCRVHTCTSGGSALTMLSNLHPDVLVLDLMLPELDGISVLKALSASGAQPIVLATTCLNSDYILETAEQLHVNYLLMKPCDIRATAARVQEQLDRLSDTSADTEDLQFQIAGLLMMMGFTVKLHGFRYLQEAICRMLTDPDQSITKELYPGVGRVFDTVGSHVERSIRGAIQKAWTYRDDRIWQLYFPPDSQGNMGKPTNAAFITRLADGLRIGGPPLHRLKFIPSDRLSDCGQM